MRHAAFYCHVDNTNAIFDQKVCSVESAPIPDVLDEPDITARVLVSITDVKFRGTH